MRKSFQYLDGNICSHLWKYYIPPASVCSLMQFTAAEMSCFTSWIVYGLFV